MPEVILYTLILCSGADIPCESQRGAYIALTRQECQERMFTIRWVKPDQRVVCMTERQDDVIDSAHELQPYYMSIAPSR